MAESSAPKSYSTDPTLYLYTSLTAGSSHIHTATSRLDTILKANKVSFQYLDVATDEKARMLWGRRAGKRKLPGLVRAGMVLGDLEEIEDWNEYGELRENIGEALPPKATQPSSTSFATPLATASQASALTPTSTITAEKSNPAVTTASSSTNKAESTSTNAKSAEQVSPKPVSGETTLAMAMRDIGAEAAKRAAKSKMKLMAVKGPVAGKLTTTPVAPEAVKSLEHSTIVPGPIDSDKQDEEIFKPALSTGSAERLTEEKRLATVPGGLKAPTKAPTMGGSIIPAAALSPLTLGLGATQHRGSLVASASAEEIRALERDQAIPEEPELEAQETEADAALLMMKLMNKNPRVVTEKEDEMSSQPMIIAEKAGQKVDASSASADKANEPSKGVHEAEKQIGKAAEDATAGTPERPSKVSPSKTSQADSPSAPKTQDQPAAAGELATTSVED